MKVLPEDLFPPDVKTPEERMEHLGRKLFAPKNGKTKTEPAKPTKEPPSDAPAPAQHQE